MRVNIKGLARWVGILLLTMLLTPTAVLLMLYTTAIQDVASQWAVAWIAKQTGTTIQMESLRLRYPLKIEMRGLRAGTMLSIDRFSTNIRLHALLQGVIKADHISAEGISYHTDTLTATVPADITAQQFNAINILYN